MAVSRHVSYRIVGSDEGLQAFGYDIIRYLGLYNLALRGYKMGPIDNGVITAVLTVTFSVNGVPVEESSQAFLKALRMRPDITSVEIVPTEH